MNPLIFALITTQSTLCLVLLYPLILKLIKPKTESENYSIKKFTKTEADYGLIVTYYQNIELLPGLVESIKSLKYKNFIVYIIIDNFDGEVPDLPDSCFVLLRPPNVLANNVRSHRFAIDNFVRPHQRIAILDGDNLVSPYFLDQLNIVFNEGYQAVQGAREAKNSETGLASLDAIGDLYYRYIDRKLLFDAGSSATLSGSGMAFTTEVYLECLHEYKPNGAGFDKVLQYEIVKRDLRIAFSNKVVVFDQKTSGSEQLVKQRARWIGTWFKSYSLAWKLLLKSILRCNRNQLLFSLSLLRPPLFIILSLVFVLGLLNVFFAPAMNILILISLGGFVTIFRSALNSFNSPSTMAKAYNDVPKFVFLQFVALIKSRYGDVLSVATDHTPKEEKSPHTKKKIHIMHTIRQGEVGGGESHVLDLVSNLDLEKFELTVLSFSDGAMVEKLRRLDVNVYVIPTTTPFDFRVWAKVSKLLETNSIDILHAHGTRAFSNTFLSAKKYGIPIVYTVHGWSFHPDQTSLTKWFRVKCEGFLIQRANLTVLVSQSDLLEGTRHLGTFRHRVIKNSINLEKYDPNKTYFDFRKEIGLTDDVFLVGFIARITKQKNLEILLEAIRKIPLEYKICLVVIGGGDLKDKMVDKASDLQILDRVKFLDFRNDVVEILSSIDAYCLPSLWEGLSIGLLEAMAMEKAVIVSKVKGNVELIKHLENGIVVEINSDKIKDAIVKLYKNPNLGAMLAANARKTILNEFTIQEMILKTENSYLQLMENR